MSSFSTENFRPCGFLNFVEIPGFLDVIRKAFAYFNGIETGEKNIRTTFFRKHMIITLTLSESRIPYFLYTPDMSSFSTKNFRPGS